MEIEVDILDSEQVLQEAESLVESTTNETALDAVLLDSWKLPQH